MTQLTPELVEEIRRLDEDSIRSLSKQFGLDRATVRKIRARRGRLAVTVPNEPFRQRFEELQRREGLTLNRVSIRMGCEQKNPGKGDPTYVGRLLGLRPRQYDGSFASMVSYEAAQRLSEALHMDPVEVDL